MVSLERSGLYASCSGFFVYLSGAGWVRFNTRSSSGPFAIGGLVGRVESSLILLRGCVVLACLEVVGGFIAPSSSSVLPRPSFPSI